MNIEKKYNRDDFLIFLKSFVPNFTKDVRSVSVSGLQVTKEVSYLGESAELDLSIFELTHSSSSDARVALAMDGFKVMKGSATYRALVIYRSEKGEDWRLSLMTASPIVNEKGKVGQAFSNPRRSSFFLGPNAKVNTPYQFLIKQGAVKDFVELQKRFSLEVVNKEFYSQIALLFTQLAGGKRTIGKKSIDAGRGLLNLPSTVDDTLDKEFTVRLIGRLVFCWFLKKKRSEKNIPLLPEELLSAKAVSENKGYYHGILEPLFFEVLNTPVDNREKKYHGALWSQIPFLNGGLFTPHQHDFYELGSLGISKHINTLKVPDQWIKELFEIFETYNFTIDENTSIDVELSIEPEMLGRIFENLLAEINPETGETARKATGSYYTPRPIVEYMVDESLKQYLLTKTKLDENKIKSLLTYEDLAMKLTESEKESVLSALDALKVIDPACGSGAFPMGILQKMLLILQKVDPESEWWLERKLSKIESKLLKRELWKKLKSENVNYVHKLGIIQSSIYGVDIQPIAVEISKLRFFLSLIVDETVNDAKENRGIEPLPNLEFKFVCTNSLIGLPKKEKNPDQLFETEDTESINELKDLRDEYLRSYGIEKEKIQIKFLKTQRKMAEFYWKHVLRPQTDLSGSEKKMKKQDAPEFTRMLSNWDPFSDEPAGWFDSEWMFGIKDGFDIVIANPPYISFYSRQAKELEEGLRTYFQKNYIFLQGMNKKSINTVMLFLEKAIRVLSTNGNFAYIIDIGFFEKVYKEIRKFLSCYDINLIMGNLSAFENVASGQLIIMGRHTEISPENFNCVVCADFNNQIRTLSYNDFIADTFTIDNDGVSISFKEVVPLVNLVNITCGLEYGALRDLFLSDSKVNTYYHKALFGGQNIPNKYELVWSARDGYVLFDKNYEQELIRKKMNYSETRRYVHFISGDESKYLDEKLLIRQSAMEIIATYDNDKYYAMRSIFLVNKKTDKTNLKYILGLLNSKLISSYALQSGIIRYQKGKQPQIRVAGLEQIPIKVTSLKNEVLLKNFVDYALFLVANKTEMFYYFQCLIDAVVYELYFSDEIKFADCEVIKHLTNLAELKDDWSDDKKLATIEEVYKKLSDSRHPVSVAMSKMQELEEVRIIEGKK